MWRCVSFCADKTKNLLALGLKIYAEQSPDWALSLEVNDKTYAETLFDN